MGQISIYEIVSSDGYNARTDGSIDWSITFQKEKGGDIEFVNYYSKIESVVLSEAHYHKIISLDIEWPYHNKISYIVTDTPQPSLTLNPLSEYIKYLIKLPHQERSELVATLKKESKGNIWIAGDNKMIFDILRSGLVENVTLCTLPLKLGKGTQFVKQLRKIVKITKTQRIKQSNGVVIVDYRIAAVRK